MLSRLRMLLRTQHTMKKVQQKNLAMRQKKWVRYLQEQQEEREDAEEKTKIHAGDWKRFLASKDPTSCHPSWRGHDGFIPAKWDVRVESPVFHRQMYTRRNDEMAAKTPFALRRLRSYVPPMLKTPLIRSAL